MYVRLSLISLSHEEVGNMSTCSKLDNEAKFDYLLK